MPTNGKSSFPPRRPMEGRLFKLSLSLSITIVLSRGEEQHLINKTASAIMMFLVRFRFLFSCRDDDREQDKVRVEG